MPALDLVKLLKEKDNLIVAEWLVKNADKGKQAILSQKLIPELEKIAKKNGLLFDSDLSESRYSYFCFYQEDSWQYSILFEFGKSNYQSLYSGIYIDNGQDSEISDSKRNKLENIAKNMGMRTNSYFPCGKYFNEEYRNWDSNVFEQISNDPKKLLNQIEDFVTRMCSELRNVKMMK